MMIEEASKDRLHSLHVRILKLENSELRALFEIALAVAREELKKGFITRSNEYMVKIEEKLIKAEKL